jgi:hypothetical protein
MNDTSVDNAVKPPEQPIMAGKTPDEVRELYNSGKIDFKDYEKAVTEYKPSAEGEQPAPSPEAKKPEEKLPVDKEIPLDDDYTKHRDEYASRYTDDERKLKGLIEKDKHIRRTTERARSAEEKAERAAYESSQRAKEADDLRKEIERLTAEVQKKPVAQVEKETAAAVATATEQGKLPVKPTKPTNKRDALDENSIAEWDKYYDDLNTYHDARTELMEANFNKKLAAAESKTTVDPAILAEIKAQKEEIAALKIARNQEVEAERFELNTQRTYQELGDFVKDHKTEFKFSDSVSNLDTSYQSWMDDVARIAGVKKIGNDKYLEERLAAAQKWFQNDVAIVKACEDNAIKFPMSKEEYDAYYELSQIKNVYDKFKPADPEFSMDDAWLHHKNRNGKLDELMTHQFVRGAKATEELKNKRGSEFAKTLPPDSGTHEVSIHAADMKTEEQEALQAKVHENPNLISKTSLEFDTEITRLYHELEVLWGMA